MDIKTQNSLLEMVKKNYGEIAEDFNETRQKVIWPELAKLSERVKTYERVLDAGCGNGRLLQAFRLKPISYIGLDSNKQFIEFAKKSWALPRGRFVHGDILEMDKNMEVKGSFDYIFCIAVIHNIPGNDLRVKALKQLLGKADRNGQIIISVWNLWNKWKYLNPVLKFSWLKIIGKNDMDWGDIVFEWRGKRKSRRYYHAFTKAGLRKLAKEAGATIEKLYKDKYNYYLILRADIRQD